MERAGVRSGVGLAKWSIYGSLFFLISSIVASIVAQGLWGLFVLLYVGIWSVLMSPDALGTLKQWRFWFLLVSLIAISAVAVGGEETRLVAGVSVSLEGVSAGVGMALRAATIVLATAAFARSASIGGMTSLFARLGASQIGFLLGIAVNLLPMIQNTASSVFVAMRLRGGFRKNRFQAAKRLIVTILVNSLRYSEDIVCAAEARAFGNAQPARSPVVFTTGDSLFALASGLFYGALIVARIAGS